MKRQQALVDHYQGEYIYKDVNGGSRAYQFKKQLIADTSPNSYLMLLGSLFTFSGLFGFFVEFRLRKI